jgi:hypothetical protein
LHLGYCTLLPKTKEEENWKGGELQVDRTILTGNIGRAPGSLKVSLQIGLQSQSRCQVY